MNIFYHSNKIKKSLSSAGEIKANYGEFAKKVSMRLDDIRAAPNLLSLTKIPQAKCHLLKGDLIGKWALSVSPNYRMIFEVKDDPVPIDEYGEIDLNMITDIIIVGCIDYHN